MDIGQTLQELEQRLLTASVRQDAREVSSLLADEFREFGSSGRTLLKKEIIELLRSETSVSPSLKDVEACSVSDGAVLLTYRSVKQVPGSPPTESLRSSLWVYRDGRWQMLFHQGTNIPN